MIRSTLASCTLTTLSVLWVALLMRLWAIRMILIPMLLTHSTRSWSGFMLIKTISAQAATLRVRSLVVLRSTQASPRALMIYFIQTDQLPRQIHRFVARFYTTKTIGFYSLACTLFSLCFSFCFCLSFSFVHNPLSPSLIFSLFKSFLKFYPLSLSHNFHEYFVIALYYVLQLAYQGDLLTCSWVRVSSLSISTVSPFASLK